MVPVLVHEHLEVRTRSPIIRSHVTPKKNHSLVASECHMGRSCPVIICYLHPSTPNFIHPNFSGPSRRTLKTSLAFRQVHGVEADFLLCSLESKRCRENDRLESQKKTISFGTHLDSWWLSHLRHLDGKSMKIPSNPNE